MTELDRIFSDRIADVPRSFIREILKVAMDPGVISFAGGLPNRELFPVAALKDATARLFDDHGRDVLQYGSSEGHPGLREQISARYREKANLDVPVEDILITSGSQQGLDLLGKVILNDGDPVVIEEPGYLGAIQAFSMYRARFLPVPVSEEGMDVDALRAELAEHRPKLMYTVPNFQNPSGISYSEANRSELAQVLEGTQTLLIEDDPYGDLRFRGQPKSSFLKLLPEHTVLLGSFSKSLVPGLRLGWIVAPPPLMQKLLAAKQATDLHTSHFTQGIVHQYLRDNDPEAHIAVIREVYGRQCRAMQDAMREYFPPEVQATDPEGGMFLWAELPAGLTAMDLFQRAFEDKVVFVPGDPFYVRGSRHSTLRLNFSCADTETIFVGMERLGRAIHSLMDTASQSIAADGR
ncbi:aminotransferase-like domain-containing protein [Algiphilus aromaticivorans]|uniref:aminotransferase-like domain-containing protein n=1 Tax=Algiphilus aromaticivorans TaxID=382454 RepID=UPI000AC8E412|nr:PLP-dependent aminotransferase family protein [Algiphilus aromaticivorans]